MEHLRRILDHLPESVRRVRLSGIGEPLLNPDFFALVDALADRDLLCDFFTNGTLLSPLVRAEILSRSNIDRVLISCDGARAATFEASRAGADFENWKRLVGEFVAEARQLRPDTLGLRMSTVVSKQNLGEVQDIVRMAAELGFREVTVRRLIPLDDISASLGTSETELSSVLRDDVAETAAALGVYIDRLQTLPWDVPPGWLPRCLEPWEYAFIRANGDVQPCSALWESHKAAVMGNALEQEFDSIWCGDRFAEYRRTSALGKNALCSGCPDSHWK